MATVVLDLVDVRRLVLERSSWSVGGDLQKWRDLYSEVRLGEHIPHSAVTYSGVQGRYNTGSPNYLIREYGFTAWLPPRPAGTYRMEWRVRHIWVACWPTCHPRASWDLGGISLDRAYMLVQYHESPLWRTWNYKEPIVVYPLRGWTGPLALPPFASGAFGWTQDICQVRYTY